MTLQRLELFNTKKEIVLSLAFLTLILSLHLLYIFYQYKTFLNSKTKVDGEVRLVYEKLNKKGMPYTIAKIKTNEFTIYTKIHKKLSNNDKIRFNLYKKRVSFSDFLSKKFYAPTYKIELLKNNSPTKLKHKLQTIIQNQHENKELKELYSALFLATQIDKKLREKIQNWGISHLVAISGFHLGVIYFNLFFILKLLYGYIHNRFLPYRNINFDLGIVIFCMLNFYTYLLEFSPSFLRALTMGLIGFFIYNRHLKVLTFANLAISGSLLVVLFPHLLMSLSFWFSIMGVFYIFLYLHHFNFSKLDFIFINIWVYLGMIIPTHYFFPYISLQQVLSVPLSIIFTIFYPLSLLLHLIGYGGVFDELLKAFLDIKFQGHFVLIPQWVFLGYIALSLLSIKNRYLAFFVILCPTILFI